MERRNALLEDLAGELEVEAQGWSVSCGTHPSQQLLDILRRAGQDLVEPEFASVRVVGAWYTVDGGKRSTAGQLPLHRRILGVEAVEGGKREDKIGVDKVETDGRDGKRIRVVVSDVDLWAWLTPPLDGQTEGVLVRNRDTRERATLLAHVVVAVDVAFIALDAPENTFGRRQTPAASEDRRAA